DRVHLHAVDDGQEILFGQTEVAHRLAEAGDERADFALKERAHLRPPLVELRLALRPRAARVRDIVDAAAEVVDLIHGVALRLRQDTHCRVERAAGGALRRTGRCRTGRCGSVHARPHALRGAWDAVQTRPSRLRGPLHNPTSPTAATPDLVRCTRSLNGSRVRSMATRRQASAWMTATSNARRESRMLAEKAALCSSNLLVRATRPCRHRRSAGVLAVLPRSSTVAPAAASASPGT